MSTSTRTGAGWVRRRVREGDVLGKAWTDVDSELGNSIEG